MLGALLVVVACFNLVLGQLPPGTKIRMQIFNNCGAAIDAYWMNPTSNDDDGINVLVKPLRNNANAIINTYANHAFKMSFVKPSLNASISVSAQSYEPWDEDDYNDPIHVKYIISYDKTTNQMMAIRDEESRKVGHMVEEVQFECRTPSTESTSASECMARGITQRMAKETIETKRTIIENNQYTNRISDRLTNYACLDKDLESSRPLSSKLMDVQGSQYLYKMLLNVSHAQIWTIQDFATSGECDELERRMQIIYGSESSESSSEEENNMNNLMRINSTLLQLDTDMDKDPLYPLYTRILDSTVYHTGFNLQPQGQEHFTVFDYGEKEGHHNHCDTQCEGDAYHSGGRVATAMLYCKVPREGGLVTFGNSDIFIRPQVGMAIFFSYKGNDGLMDTGYTTHGACPVKKGNMIVATSYMREGVTAEEPFSSYDPAGKLNLEEEEINTYTERKRR